MGPPSWRRRSNQRSNLLPNNPSTMTKDNPALLHPKPRKHYDLTPTSSNSSFPSTPSRQPSDASRVEGESNGNEEKPISKNRSILNLTSSTLFGIYTPSASGYDTNREEPSTPWGNGSQTPARASIDDTGPPTIDAFERPQAKRTQSHQQHFRFWETFVPLSERVILLFIIGVAYGVIISHLHDSQQVAPVQIKAMEHGSWGYLLGWGGVGVLLGGLLPWVDVLWEEALGNDTVVFTTKHEVEESRPLSRGGDEDERPASRPGSGLGADWNPVVRSIGAFVGIAFAIVKTPSSISKGSEPKLTSIAAQAPLAIHFPSLPDSSTRQPSALVPRRPLETRLPPLYSRRPGRDSHRLWSKPRNSTLPRSTITTGRDGEHFISLQHA